MKKNPLFSAFLAAFDFKFKKKSTKKSKQNNFQTPIRV